MERRNNPSQGLRVSFRATKRADVFYDIPVEDARKISFNKAGKEFDAKKTVGAVAAVGALSIISLLILLSSDSNVKW